MFSDFTCLDFYALTGIGEELKEIAKGSIFVDEARCNTLCKALKGRVRMLEKVALSARHTVFFENMQSDVIRDIAYSGKDVE